MPRLIKLIYTEEDLKDEELEEREFYNHWIGRNYSKCCACYGYFEKRKGFPEDSIEAVYCNKDCHDNSFKKAGKKPTTYLKDGIVIRIDEE